MKNLILIFLAVVALCAGAATASALDASEQSVAVLAAGPADSFASCTYHYNGTSAAEIVNGTNLCDAGEMGGGGDTFNGNGYGDWGYGEEGNDILNGGSGPDYLGAGCRGGGCSSGTANELNGGYGDDILGGRNGRGGDRLDCGPGTGDHGWYDVGSTDTIKNCEFRNQ